MNLTSGVISTEHALFPDPGLIAVGLIVVGGLWLLWNLIPWKRRESGPVSAGSLPCPCCGVVIVPRLTLQHPKPATHYVGCTSGTPSTKGAA